MENQIIETLKDQGLQITAKRLLIVEALCNRGYINDVEEFWLELRKTYPISWATVHSNLRLMTRCGILQRENQGFRFVTYQLAATS